VEKSKTILPGRGLLKAASHLTILITITLSSRLFELFLKCLYDRGKMVRAKTVMKKDEESSPFSPLCFLL
jgi:hypothetical protein